MLAIALAVLAFQQASVTVAGRPTSATGADVASAFADAGAGALLARARVARLGQDSSIAEYDASTVQRLTVGLAVPGLGRDVTMFESESASRVHWTRGSDAQIEATGKRGAEAAAGTRSGLDVTSMLSPVPYYPGRDNFGIGLGTIRNATSTDGIINPLSAGAEAYYTYRTGDSITFHLTDQTSVRLRELEVHPRRASWSTVEGSLWFDVKTGQLVRAAFRMASPAKAVGDSTEASIDSVAIEYGLHEGRFWLPRSEVMQGHVSFGPVRLPMKIEEQFTYAFVRGTQQ